MKKITSLLLTFILCITLISCTASNESTESTVPATENISVNSETETDTESESESESETETDESRPSEDIPDEAGTSTPLLYKVTDNNGNTAWLFGSIHVGRESFYPLPDYVIDAYEGADKLAVEFDTKAFSEDFSAQTMAMSKLIYRTGATIEDEIDKELYDKAVEIMTDYGIYNKLLDHYLPIMWSNLIDNILYEKLGVQSDLGIDNYFIERAYEEEKPILDVESAEFQYTMLANFSEELQERLLMESIENYKSYESGDGELTEELNTMMDLWESGDEEEFASYLNEEYEFEDEEEEVLYKEYEKALETDRNISMADFAEDVIDSGDEVFICVGAAHIVGDDAVADLLSERGYTVELIGK